MIRIKIALILIVIAFLFLAYMATVCPTVEFIDSGELALACEHLGICHPTGYPLYTLLGRIAAMCFPGELISRVNYLSLFLTACAGGFLSLLIFELIALSEAKSRWQPAVAISVALFTALTPVWWAQGTTNEVYSLNLPLIVISILGLVRYFGAKGDPIRQLLLSGYALGLALSNHLSAAYLIPGFAAVLAAEVLQKRIRGAALLWFSLFFLFPMTLYFFLPIRAAFSPFLNWGGVSDPYFLYKHISGWQYRIWMFSDSNFDIVAQRIVYSGKLMVEQFGWPGLIAAALGIFATLAKNVRIGLFLILCALFNLIYVLNYQIADIDSYYLPITIMVAVFMASGLFYVVRLTSRALSAYRPVKIIMAAILLIIPISNFIDNFYKSDRSKKMFARQAAIDIARSMEPGGLALVENWDFYSPWLYLRFAANYRNDLTLLDKELMRRSWYIDFVRRYQPDIYARSMDKIEEFVARVEPFEKNRPFDPMIIDRAYYEMLGAIMENESKLRAVYTNVAGDPKFIRLLPLAPDGILFRVYRQPEFLQRPLWEFDKSYWSSRFVYKEARIGQLLSYYRRALAARENYCRQFGKTDEADYYGRQASEVLSVMSDIDK